MKKYITLLIVLFLKLQNCFCQAPKLVVPTNDDLIYHSSFSFNDKFVLTTGKKVVKLWDSKTGKLLQTLDGHTDYISTAQFSTDSKMILTSSLDGTAIVWETQTGKKLHSLKGHQWHLLSADFISNNRKIVTVSQDNTSRIWDVATGKCLKILASHKTEIRHSCISHNDKIFVTSSKDSETILWDVETGKILYRIPSYKYFVIDDIKFNMQDKQILISYDKKIDFFDIEKLKVTRTLDIGSESNSLEINPNGKEIITFSTINKNAYLWNIENYKLSDSLVGHSKGISSVCFNKSGNQVITASEDSSSIFWKLSQPRYFSSFREHLNIVNNVSFSNDEKLFISSSFDGSAIVWDINSQKSKTRLTGSALFLSSITTYKENDVNITTTNNNLSVWKNSTKAHIFDMNKHTKQIISNDISSDGNIISTISFDRSVYLWNVRTKSYELQLPETDYYRAAFTRFSQILITNSYDKVCRAWNPNTGANIWSIQTNNYELKKNQISPDGKYLVIELPNEKKTNDGNGVIIDAINGKIIDTLSHNSQITDIQFSPDGKFLAISFWNGTIKIWNVPSFTFVKKITASNNIVYTLAFAPDGKILASASYDNSIKFWNTENNFQFIKSISSMYNGYRLGFSQDNKYLTLIENTDENCEIWNIATGNLFFKGFSRFCNFDLDRKNKVWISNQDGGMMLYDLLMKDTALKRYYFSSLGTLDITKKGFYSCFPQVSKLLHYVTKDLKIVTFDQLDIKYNRPDKVLEAIGSTDTVLINSYKKAYLKRIKKLGIDTSSFKEGFTIPEADFKNREAVEYEQKNKQLTLQITGNSTENLDRINLWINEVPLYGQRGINLRFKNKKSIDTTINVNLSEGDNQVETSITDVNGIESYRQPLFVKYVPQKSTASKTYFIGLGINRFADSSRNLNWSVKDIRDLANKFSSKGAVIDTLFDEKVTIQNVLQLKRKLLQTGEEDKVIIAYSGHGLLSSDYDYFLSTYSVNFNQPQKNGLPYEELENLLDGIKARKKLLLIDACHSGEVDKDEMKNYTVAKDSLDKKGDRGLIITQTDKSKVGLKNSFELMQELFVNVGRGTGTTVISAASGTQSAEERNNLENGVFSYCLLKAMNTINKIKISDLKKIVTEKVPELTNGLQKPTFRSETQQYDWELW